MKPLHLQNIAIKVGRSVKLSEIIQRLYFNAGFSWLNGTKTLRNINGNHYCVGYHYGANLCIGIQSKCLVYAGTEWRERNGYTILDAETQMGEIVKLFEKPSTLAPVINGYPVSYNKGDNFLYINNTKVGTGLIQDLFRLMCPSSDCRWNNNIIRVELSNGVKLTNTSIDQISKYISDVNAAQ